MEGGVGLLLTSVVGQSCKQGAISALSVTPVVTHISVLSRTRHCYRSLFVALITVVSPPLSLWVLCRTATFSLTTPPVIVNSVPLLYTALSLCTCLPRSPTLSAMPLPPPPVTSPRVQYHRTSRKVERRLVDLIISSHTLDNVPLPVSLNTSEAFHRSN